MTRILRYTLALAAALGSVSIVPACGLESGGLGSGSVSNQSGSGAGPESRVDAASGTGLTDPESQPIGNAPDAGGIGPAAPPSTSPMYPPIWPPPDAAADRTAPPPPDASTPDRRPPDTAAPPMRPDAAPILPPLPVDIDLNRGLIYYTRLDDGSASVNPRDEAKPPNLVSLNDFNKSAAWVEGRFGMALEFPGGPGGGWLRVQDSVALNSISHSLSASAWIFLENQSAAANGVIVARRASGPGGFIYMLQLTAGRLRVRINSSNGYNADHQSAQPVPTGRWVHVAVTYDVHETRFFIDGRPAGGGEYLHLIPPEISSLTIGAAETLRDVITDRLSGRLDEVILYNRALPAAEVSALATGYRPAPR